MLALVVVRGFPTFVTKAEAMGWEEMRTPTFPVLVTKLFGKEFFTRKRIVSEPGQKRRINIVDAASFTVMRELGLETAFAFDSDFAREGFKVVPA